MKRDWKLIRAIVREEDTSAWPPAMVLEGYSMLIDAGYVHGIISISIEREEFIRTRPALNTSAGIELANALANAEDLDAVLRELDEKQLGHVSEIVLEMMDRRARLRLGLTDADSEKLVAKLTKYAEAQMKKASFEDRGYWIGFIDGLKRKIP